MNSIPLRLNSVRLGSPTTNLIHFPSSIAVLNNSGMKANSLHLKIDDFIDRKASLRAKPTIITSHPYMEKRIKSLQVPIRSFNEFRITRRYFGKDYVDTSIKNVANLL